MNKLIIFSMTAALIFSAAACGPKYVRDTDVDDLDEAAMGTGLDRKDLERLFDENIASLLDSTLIKNWTTLGEPPVVAVFPITNETSEHISGQLKALLSKVETKLINSGVAQVVSHESQEGLIEQVEKQQSEAYNPAQVAQYGRQLGARYFITGKVYDAAERTEDGRRVQYFLFMQALDAETGLVRWQNEAKLTKAVLD